MNPVALPCNTTVATCRVEGAAAAAAGEAGGGWGTEATDPRLPSPTSLMASTVFGFRTKYLDSIGEQLIVVCCFITNDSLLKSERHTVMEKIQKTITVEGTVKQPDTGNSCLHNFT